MLCVCAQALAVRGGREARLFSLAHTQAVADVAALSERVAIAPSLGAKEWMLERFHGPEPDADRDPDLSSLEMEDGAAMKRNNTRKHKLRSKSMLGKGKFTALPDDKDDLAEQAAAQASGPQPLQQQQSSCLGRDSCCTSTAVRLVPQLLMAVGALLVLIGLLISSPAAIAAPLATASEAQLHPGGTPSPHSPSMSMALLPPQQLASPPPPPMPMHPPPSPHTPAPSPAPLMPPGASVVAALNARWANGFASNNLSQAGILLHTFDNVDGDNVRNNVWLPCSDTGYWCSGYEVSSASLVNRRLPHWFNMDWAGVILSPTALSPLSDSIRCSFAYDAGTMGDPSGCPGMECDDDFASLSYCHWGSHQLGAMLQQHEELEGSGNDRPCGLDECDYNEVVIDADFWVRALPAVVEAFFFPRDSRDAEWRARDVLSSFREHYGSAVADVPLVSIGRHPDDADAPFSLVDPDNCCVSPD